MSASAAIRQFLFEAQQRVACHAIAFTPPSRDHFDFHCSAADAADVRRILESRRGFLPARCRNRPSRSSATACATKPTVRCSAASWPRPCQDDKGQLEGVTLIFRTMEQQAFSKGRRARIGSARTSARKDHLAARPTR
jgi:hypothetical protein